ASNRDPLNRIQVFELLPLAFTSLEEAIQAAKDHFRGNYGQGIVPQFRVYQSTDPDGTTYAFVEVTRGNEDMVFVALYKIIVGKYQWAIPTSGTMRTSTIPPLPGSGSPLISPTDMPPPAGVPPQNPRLKS